MLAILITILGHFAYGTTNVLWKNPNNEIGTLPLIIFRSFCCFLIFFASHFFLTNLQIIPKSNFTNTDLLQTIGICSVNYFGLFFYLKSLKHSPVSNVIGFSKIGLIIGIAIGYFVYHQNISPIKSLICIVIFIGVTFIEKSNQTTNFKPSKGLVYTLLSRIFWSTAFLFVPFINKFGPLLFCAILELTVFSLSIVLFLIKPVKINFQKVTIKLRTEIFLLVLLGTIGTFSLNFAIAKMNIILFAFMGLIEPIIGLIISKFYHKETLTNFQKIGIALGILSAFVLSIVK